MGRAREPGAMRIIVAEQNDIVRKTFCSLLAKQAFGKVVAEAVTASEAIHLTRELSPDVVLLGSTLPDMKWSQAIRAVLAEDHGVRVIVLFTYRDRRYVTEALSAGAAAILSMDSVEEELKAVIEAVAAR